MAIVDVFYRQCSASVRHGCNVFTPSMVCREGFENDPVEKMRHSSAHVMADAVQRLFPEAKITIGPVIEDGFFYDFDYPKGFTPEDLVKIEAEMAKIIQENLPFEKTEMTKKEAIAFFKKREYTTNWKLSMGFPTKK